MDRNSTETTIAVDAPTGPYDLEQPNTRSLSISDAVRKISKSRHLNPDLNRRPFFALVRSGKIGVKPWPSATNLMRSPNEHKSFPRRGSFNLPPVDFRQPSENNNSRVETLGFVNSAFSQERIDDSDSRYRSISDDAPESFRPRLHSCPKYLSNRQSYVRPKKGVHWKTDVKEVRRRTIDSVPSAQKILSLNVLDLDAMSDSKSTVTACSEGDDRSSIT